MAITLELPKELEVTQARSRKELLLCAVSYDYEIYNRLDYFRLRLELANNHMEQLQ